MARENVHRFEKRNMHPATFGGEDDFRFDFSYASEEGLDYRGFAEGADRNKRLYLVMYIGTALHYYEKYSAEVEKILKSVEFK